MIARLLAAALVSLGLSSGLRSADEEPTPKPTRNEAMRAKMVEDAKTQAAKPTITVPAKSAATPAKTVAAPVAPTGPKESADAAKTASEAATVLPKIEVNRGKIHPLARELYEKEKEISREKQLTKPTELDKALNHPKISVPILGGQSTASRASVASERTSLLEAEADLIEEIGRAKTKEQKAELRKQLDELKKIRRDLEHAIR